VAAAQHLFHLDHRLLGTTPRTVGTEKSGNGGVGMGDVGKDRRLRHNPPVSEVVDWTMGGSLQHG
jgi:hypothetical protein